MNSRLMLVIGAVAGVATAAVAATAGGPTDPQIAHIAYTAGSLDIAAAKQALAKSHDPQVRDFAQLMLRDHEAVNVQALALVKKLGVTPEANGTSQALEQQAAATMRRLASLQGSAFDRAYVANEAAFHKAVNAALADTLVPSAQNGELKALLETGLTLFKEHQAHAEHLAAKV
jgi:putative membrane protein